MPARATMEDLDALASELESLGGGDARVGVGASFALVRPTSGASVVATHGETILVRDPKCPAHTPEHDAVRRFSATASPVGSAEVFASVGAPALDSLLDGFSTAIVAMGEAGAGKSHALFGPDGVAEPERHGLCPRLLAELCDVVKARSSLTLGIACWEVRHDRVVDLLRAGGPDGQQAAAAAAGGPHPYVLVHAPTIREAHRLLSLARARSMAAPLALATAAVPARASLFIRLALHDAERECLASLYVVDLVGTAPLPTASEAAALAALMTNSSMAPSESGTAQPPVTPGMVVAERRGLNRQHAAVNRMLAELGALGDGSDSQQALGARDSRLTLQLAPLLVGSCRTQLLACVHSATDHFPETCATLRAASHALALRAPCLRLTNLPLADMHLLPPQAVLPPPSLPSRSSAAMAVPPDDFAAARPALPRADAGMASPAPADWGDDEPLGWEAEYEDVIACNSMRVDCNSMRVDYVDGPQASTAMTCARLRGAGQPDEASSTPTGGPSSTVLRAELQEMMAQLDAPTMIRSPSKSAESDPAGWVTRELERRVQEELAIARSARARGSGSQPPTPVPPVILAEHAPVVRSYAAQHAAHNDVQRRQASLSTSPARTGTSARVASEPAGESSPGRREAPGKAMAPATYPFSCTSAGSARSAARRQNEGSSASALAEVEAAIAAQAEAEAEAALSEVHAMSVELAAATEASSFKTDAAHAGTGHQEREIEHAEALQSDNYETVLSLLKDSDDSRRAEQSRTEEAEHEALEKATLREIALADEKAKVLELRKKLRRLETTSVRATAPPLTARG